MVKPTVSDLRFLATDVVFPFYRIDRITPLRFEKSRHENDAEHSWSLALFACALAPRIDKQLNVGLVAQYAIVHDLVEIHAGDTSNHASAAEKATKDDREAAALHKMESELAIFPWILDTLKLYEAQTDQESAFVRSVDKILVLLFDLIDEGKLYQDEKLTSEVWQANMAVHREKARKHAGAFIYYEQIWDTLVANPEFFYQKP
jgi:putative hydrolase of HD superfamily